MHPEKYTKGPNDGGGPVHSQTMKGRPDFLGHLTVQDPLGIQNQCARCEQKGHSKEDCDQ